MTCGKFARRLERRARGNREHNVACRRSNSEREAARGGHALERDPINLAIVGDVEMRRQAFVVLQRILEGSVVFDPYAPELLRRQQIAELRQRIERRAG